MLGGACLRFAAIGFGLPYLAARPDEETTIGHAAAILAGDLNPHFFTWPSLTFYLVAAVAGAASVIRRLFSIEPALTPAHMILIARALVATAGTLTIVWMFRIGRRVGGPTMGLLSALFLAVSILHVRDSHFAMTDVLMVCFVVISLELLLRAVEVSRAHSGRGQVVRWFALSGACGGLATSTKYSAAAIVVAMVAAQTLTVMGEPRQRRLVSLGAWVPSLVFLGAFGLAFVAASPYVVLDYQHFAEGFAFDVRHLSAGHVVDLGRGWSYHFRRSLPYGAGVPTFAAAIVGIPFLIRYHGDRALVLVAFAVALYLSIGSGRTVFFRYALPLIPIVCVAAAAGVERIGTWLDSVTGVRAGASVWLIAAVVAVPSAVNCAWFDAVLAKADSRVLAAEWLIAHAESTQSMYEAPDPYSELDVGRSLHRWDFDPATATFVNAGGRLPDWLVLHESPLWTYARIPPALRRLAAERYELAYEVRPTKGATRSAVYDLQDAFFMPVSGFSAVDRPGPTVLVYRRVPQHSIVTSPLEP